MKPTEKISAHCTRCDYPIFAYHHICPMCSQPIEKNVAISSESEKTATTRFDFWVANLKRSFGTRPRASASLET
jgi:uncharacterized Zn finger protein (UPF0148 family)